MEKKLNSIQIEILSFMFLDNTSVTDKQVYDFLIDKGKDYEDTFKTMHDVYYLPDYTMPTDVNQILLPVGDVINFLKKEKSRVFLENEAIELEKKLDRELKWYNTQNAEQQWRDYPRLNRRNDINFYWAIIATACALLLAGLELWRKC